MRTSRNLVALVGAVLLMTGCSDAVAPVGDGSARGVLTSSAAAEVEVELQRVTRGVATALNDEVVRLAVRDAMRDSPWDEHQIVLQEFAGTPAGQPLVAAAARAAGESQEQFRSRLAKLPALDFYVPSRAQRQTWRGTPGVFVVASLNPEGGRVYGVGPDGQIREVQGRSGSGAPAGPVMVLHPAEFKAVRLNPQPKGQGEVIEAAYDGKAAYSYRWIEPDGQVITPNITDVLAGKDPRFTVVGEVSAMTTLETRIDCIKIRFEDGDSVTAGDVELVLKAKFYDPDGRLNGTAEFRDSDFPELGSECPSVPLIARVIPDGGPAKINVEVWEDDCDCWGNNDDYYGNRDFVWTDRGQWRTVYEGGSAWSDLELDWVAQAPSVFTSVSVAGVFVYVGSSYPTEARALDQYGYGLPGYSVSNWWTDHAAVATVSSTGTQTADVTGHSVGSTTVYATINGVTGSGPVEVHESTTCTTEPCPS